MINGALKVIYLDVLKYRFKIKAYWVADCLYVTTFKELGSIEIPGHTAYLEEAK